MGRTSLSLEQQEQRDCHPKPRNPPYTSPRNVSNLFQTFSSFFSQKCSKRTRGVARYSFFLEFNSSRDVQGGNSFNTAVVAEEEDDDGVL